MSFTSQNTLVEGVLLADKVGEVRFINANNFPHLSIEEESKNNDKYAKLLFGHYEECNGLLMSKDMNTLISIDSMNRVSLSLCNRFIG